MNKAKSKKVVAKRATNLARHTAPHSAEQHRKPLTGRIALGSAPAKASPNRETKHDKVLAMLRSKQGATIAAMMQTTGWQRHSVRGFLAGVVRKRLRLALVSEKRGNDRIYRIKAASASVSISAAKTTVARSMA